MSNTAKKLEPTESTQTDGLDDFFEAEVVPSDTEELPSNTSRESQGVTVKEASKKLGLSVKTIKDRLRKGTLKGFKASSKYGKKWMVDPSELSRSYQELPPNEPLELPGNTGEEVLGITQEEIPGTTNLNLDRLLDQIEKKDRELQAATYRNGYLESQLEVAQNQIKLLPDLQSKATKLQTQEEKIEELKSELEQYKQSNWQKFKKWFLGG